MFCLDNKKTFFTVTLDGMSAFEVVNHTIHTRELYCTAGDTGRFWIASNSEYNKSKTKIKRNVKLSDKIEETLGVKQGGSRSSDHFKTYVAPAVELVDSANLGVWMGPLNIGVSCCAVDFLGMSDNPSNLQHIIDLASYYGKLYRIQYEADKTKIVVSGSNIDRRSIAIQNQFIEVVNENDHSGQL